MSSFNIKVPLFGSKIDIRKAPTTTRDKILAAFLSRQESTYKTLLMGLSLGFVSTVATFLIFPNSYKNQVNENMGLVDQYGEVCSNEKRIKGECYQNYRLKTEVLWGRWFLHLCLITAGVVSADVLRRALSITYDSHEIYEDIVKEYKSVKELVTQGQELDSWLDLNTEASLGTPLTSKAQELHSRFKGIVADFLQIDAKLTIQVDVDEVKNFIKDYDALVSKIGKIRTYRDQLEERINKAKELGIPYDELTGDINEYDILADLIDDFGPENKLTSLPESESVELALEKMEKELTQETA